MEIQFRNDPCRCLRQTAWDVKNAEQTLELRVPPEMPGIGSVLGAWGQPVIRGKEWHGDHVLAMGGVLCRILYMPEDGGNAESLEGWLPFQIRMDLRDSERDGTVLVNCSLRSLDARVTGGGKVMVRGAISLSLEALEPAKCAVYEAAELPEDVQVLRQEYPVCVPREAGERAVMLEEELILPPGNPSMDKLLAYRLIPAVTEQKVVGDKLVFRGAVQLRMLYMGQDGSVHTYDADLPMSQYAQLDQEFGENARIRVVPVVTELEAELLDSEHLRLKTALIGQYVVCDEVMISAVEDAYSNCRSVELKKETVELPALLDERELLLPMEACISAEAEKTVDCAVMASHPRLYPGEEGLVAECEGTVQVLYYDREGVLRCDIATWENRETVKADGSTELMVSVCEEPMASVTVNEGQISIHADMPLKMQAMQGKGLEAATAVVLGEEGEPDPERPSLILRRTGELSLWELAKQSGSTVSAIRSANGLEGEPERDRMLLIPVC